MSFDIRVAFYVNDALTGRSKPIFRVSLVNVKGHEVESFEHSDFNCILAWVECRQCSL